jgi:inner membrane protein
MDTITQGLLGAATAQLGFRQRIGKDATWLAALAGIVPDLDIFIQPILSLSGMETDDLTRNLIHRGLSHSLVMIPVLSLPLALLWWRFRRSSPSPQPFGLLYACVFVALLSHPLLDWTTSYGTQLLAPFTQRRFALDFMPIIDIFYTPMLILTLAACYVIRKLKSNPRTITLIVGWIGFGLSTAYILTGGVMKTLAIQRMQTHFPRKTTTGQYQAYPQIGTIFLWRTTYRDETTWAAARVNLLYRAKPVLHHTTIQNNSWIETARQLDDTKAFDWFAMGQILLIYRKQHDAHVVECMDMRYGIRPESLMSLWSLKITFHPHGEVKETEYIRQYRNMRFGDVVKENWARIWRP